MFTGLIEEIGIIRGIRNIGGGKRFTVEGKKILSDLKIDDSVAINGACQTVVSISGNLFEVEAVEETLKKTTLSKFRSGQKVNLERALMLGSRLGGHLVQGHIDTTGKIKQVRKLSSSYLYYISYPDDFAKYIIKHGSICIDGISLTVADIQQESFVVSIIPHTSANTIIETYSAGVEVNLEFDIIGKYIEKMLKPSINDKGTSFLDSFIEQPEY